MADRTDNSGGSASPDKDEDTQRPLAGQRLAEARRARDVSINEIAKELHLDEPKVQALEENQFDMLGAPVFAKGHLRKYAELVGVPIEDVLTDYYQLNRSTGAPPVVGPTRTQPSDVKVGPWIAIVVAVVILGAGVWWFLTRDTGTEVVRTPGLLEPYAEESGREEDAPPEPAEPAATASEPPQEIQEDVAAPVEEQPQADTRSEPPMPTPATPADGQVALVMTFSGDCWTEVTDGNGSRLFFGMGQAGQSISRTGVPPLQALFGDRNNVAVTVNGDDFPLASGILRGNTTRVTIDP